MNAYRIAIFGSYAGHNAGDDAILGGVLRDLSRQHSCRFYVPVSTPRHYKQLFPNYDVCWIPIGRRYGSIKFFGLQPYYAIVRSEGLIMTQNMFFDTYLDNRQFNVLKDWSVQIPLAEKLGRVVFGYNVGMGPIKTERGKKLVRRILAACDEISFREHEGMDYTSNELGLEVPVSRGADPAFSAEAADAAIGRAILEGLGYDLQRPIVGVNVNLYIGDRHVTGSELQRDEYLATMSAFSRRLEREGNQILVLGTSTADIPVAKRLSDMVGAKLVVNDTYTYAELMSVMGHLKFLVATRMHAGVLATAMGTPVISVNYRKKVGHFMKLVGLQEYSIDLEEFNLGSLMAAWRRLEQGIQEGREELQSRICDLSQMAQKASRRFLHMIEDNR